VDLGGLRRSMRVIYGMGRVRPKRKNPSFLISYKTLFTMFPQMWITEKLNFCSKEG
jgi:hypothetical protein